ncbi:hypothetical protein EJB05_42721 [Eragrostis curvula]|uniref:RING-type domain-containing protein n=1 Tax=Eragrostis curvula TaxID=38414 RepID=A0A5J9TDC9_9POAL|nr:hypothetical protein EJB05_42690 [Eragrostis curvula]TVU09263.1 hypothetical protein EJB05_42721 [Eragrostis curvula]
MGRRWHTVAAVGVAFAAVAAAVAADRGLPLPVAGAGEVPEEEMSMLQKVVYLMSMKDGNSYQHVWPEMELGWQIVLGTLIGFFGAAFGSVGGVGGGGIFVPMLTLIIGFDPKSSTAISKCMIMGASVSTVYYNIKLKHPTLDMPVIDYDLAVLIQPMLMLGISIGVIFNVIFPDWLVTVLLIILFLGTSTKAFLKGVETWKKESIIKREAAKRLEQASEEPEYAPLPTGPGAAAVAKTPSDEATSIIKNIHWKEVGLLSFVWVAFLVLQVTKNYTSTCSVWYWVLNLLQVPVSVGVTMYEGLGLMRLVGGLLGLGGGFIMGPLFLELGIPPQVSSATATFAMMFSSSMSVVEYYLLDRFPVPYALYFVIVAFIAAIIGQHIVRRLINWLGRASLIIFILAFMIFVSAISLGGVGISNMIHKIERHEYMGFEDLCKNPLQPHPPFRIHRVTGGGGATMNSRRFQEDPGLTDDEFREAMDQLRKQKYRPSNPHKNRGENRGITQNRGPRAEASLPASEEEKTCTICLEAFVPGEQVVVTPCNHMFHPGCLTPWVKGHGNCPVCRSALCERRNAVADNGNYGDVEMDLLAMMRTMEEAFSRVRLSDFMSHR